MNLNTLKNNLEEKGYTVNCFETVIGVIGNATWKRSLGDLLPFCFLWLRLV